MTDKTPPAELETMEEIVKRKKKQLKKRAEKAVKVEDEDLTVAKPVPMA